ncbi:MAG: hypothetical protein LBK59_00535 [Bifidobacteriaceae bacterium]|jgi:hypothetical protein|nr:hypothetical protein [Bifidobacteriaceae bacterium]
MFSAMDADDILNDLPDQLLQALFDAVEAAALDWRQHTAEHPDWTAPMYERDTAGWIHARLRSHLSQRLDGLGGVSIVDREPNYVITALGADGRMYQCRVKRHNENDLISSYPTVSDRQFWGDEPSEFDELDVIRLALGYRWDRDARSVGVSVVSYRRGKNNPIWAVEIQRSAVRGSVLTFTPISPTLPAVDLLDAQRAVQPASGEE